ncbi:hypothetical protein M0811_07461 [Anaeramoeba ignava]|uniref:Uncharacterized protein n=1 Tax=Anaeramoeba ignava TaxID=1746090 RepID=A0A9Q0LPX2_ANAIG|nr:hypothetical protein M0811_07461 [Anaeramoeba ignava]
MKEFLQLLHWNQMKRTFKRPMKIFKKGISEYFTQIFIREEADLMNFLDLKNPKHLTVATLFSLAKHFCLRGEEVTNLEVGQLTFEHRENEDFIIYRQGESKNNKVVTHNTNFEPKISKLFRLSDHPKDPYNVIKVYWDYRRRLDTEKSSLFFRAINFNSTNGNLLKNQSIKSQTLLKHFKAVAKKRQEFQKKISKTLFLLIRLDGHKSISSLQIYKRSSIEKEKKVDSLLHLPLEVSQTSDNSHFSNEVTTSKEDLNHSGISSLLIIILFLLLFNFLLVK